MDALPPTECQLAPTLYVVATPIGNLADLTPRAREVLAKVDRVAAEDTRNTGLLMARLGLKKPLMAHHAHNEAQSSEGIVACLQRGESVALVSDAGTPAVSDPGAVVVRAVADAGFAVVPVPGASSVLTVVAASGLVEGGFAFVGFLPAKGKERLTQLQACLQQGTPQVLFEAPHRILDLMQALLQAATACGQQERKVCAGREMTKQHETFYRGSIVDVAQAVQNDPWAVKGEWALVLGPWVERAGEAAPAGLDLQVAIEVLLRDLPPKSVVKALVEMTGQPKNKLYDLVMKHKDQQA